MKCKNTIDSRLDLLISHGFQEPRIREGVPRRSSVLGKSWRHPWGICEKTMEGSG